MGFTAVAVNGETYSNAMHKVCNTQPGFCWLICIQELKDNKYQVIVTSPDMCLKHDRFRQLLASSGFAGTIAAIIIDEAHCISQWGEHFRTVYAELGTLRAFVPMHIPFLATSATLTPLVLAQVRDTLHIQTDMSYHVNLGNDRPNIAWFLHVMNGAKSDLEALSFLVSSSPGSNLPPDDPNYQSLKLTQTMVFFDDINVALQALKWLRNKLPRHLHNEVVVYNSRRSPYSKRRVLEDFRCGKIKILLTTEAAGMVSDSGYLHQSYLCGLTNINRGVTSRMSNRLYSLWYRVPYQFGCNEQVEGVEMVKYLRVQFYLYSRAFFRRLIKGLATAQTKTICQLSIGRMLRKAYENGWRRTVVGGR